MRAVPEQWAGGRLTVDLGALAGNWRRLRDLAAPAECAAVVKANAYGLGIENVVPALVRAGCRTFFVALPAEGVRVRLAAPDATVYVLNGMQGLYEEGFWREHGLQPVCGTADEVDAADDASLPFALHVDTGMNRLGLPVPEAERLAASRLREGMEITLVMTHFASADDRDHPMTARQHEAFRQVANRFPGVRRSAPNSAATLARLGPSDLARPGVAIYGAEALNGEPPLDPVVTLEGRVVQLREAARGETVGYGAAVTLTRPTRIAVVSVGYADGYPRAASGAGVPMRFVTGGSRGFVRGRHVPVLGRVSMDLTAFDVTDAPDVARGDWIEMFGSNVPIDEVARAAGTIGYELLTALGRRHARRYVGDRPQVEGEQ